MGVDTEEVKEEILKGKDLLAKILVSVHSTNFTYSVQEAFAGECLGARCAT